MNFFKYQKVYDKIDHYNLDKKITKKLYAKDMKWVVQEKVHGSNFSIYYDGTTVMFAKRNGFLKEDDWFYNYQLIQHKLENNIKQLYQILNQDKIVVYGELFGGFYPKDPNNWKNNRINEKGVCHIPFENRAVQEGIYYSPNLEYMVFDIAYVNDVNQDQLIFLDFDEYQYCLKQTNFLYSKALAVTDLSSALNYNLEFNSHIPKELYYSDFSELNNTAEGIVIKPEKTILFGNNQRCIIKKKNKLFQEISDIFNMEEAKKSYQFVFIKMINSNRCNAVVSKMGSIDYDKIVEKLMEDIWEDYYINFNYPIKNYEEANKYLKQLCMTFILENYIQVEN